MKMLKLVRKEQAPEDEYPTYIFRVSKVTAEAFEEYCNFVAWYDEQHISVSGNYPFNLIHDDFVEVGLNPQEYGL